MYVFSPTNSTRMYFTALFVIPISWRLKYLSAMERKKKEKKRKNNGKENKFILHCCHGKWLNSENGGSTTIHNVGEPQKHKSTHNYEFMYKIQKQAKLIYIVSSQDYGYHCRGRKWEGIMRRDFWDAESVLS